MDNKMPTWGSTRSKLAQEGYIYRMKLGNPATTSNSQPGPRCTSSSTPWSNVRPGAPTGPSPPKYASTGVLSADKTALELRTISGLLAQLNLGRVFRGDQGLDPNSAMEFLYRCFTPFVIHRRHKSVSFELANFIDAGMLQDSMLAQALVVWTSDVQAKFSPASGNARDFLLSQRSTVLRELRKRISSQESCTSDSVLWTVLLLAATEFIHDNMDAMATHLGALRHIIRLRGGFDSPTLSRWVKIPLLQLEKFMHYRQFHQVRRASSQEGKPAAEGSPYHFTQSFPDGSARMPPGFAELFHMMPVNEQVFDVVESVCQWTEQIAEGAEVVKEREVVQSAPNIITLDSHRAFDLLQQGKLGTAERLLVLGVLSYCIYMNDQLVYSVMEWGLRLHCMAEVTKHMEPMERAKRDSLVWAAAVLMAAGGDGSPQYQLGRRVYRACCGAHSSVRDILQITQRYFWHADLTEKLNHAGFDRTGRGSFGDLG